MQPSWLLHRDMGATESPGRPPASCLLHRLSPCRCHCEHVLLPWCLPRVTHGCQCCSLLHMGPLLLGYTSSLCTLLSPPSSCTRSPVPSFNKCLINSISSSFHVHFNTQISLDSPHPAFCQRWQVIPIFFYPLRYYFLKFLLEILHRWPFQSLYYPSGRNLSESHTPPPDSMYPLPSQATR